uniref:GLTSCR protein conserved domain-containing protein n=1 Tax=Panagrolaimus sp. JU765 TaxID=591449 RepID=A0AC34PUF5_9BILA
MSNNDTASYDEFNLISGQDWFFDELQDNSHAYDFNVSLNGPLDNGPSGSPAPAPAQQSSQIQHNSNNIYQSNVGQVDDSMPSTSDYGMTQQHVVPQHNQPVQQHQHNQIAASSQQQYETLRPYSSVPQSSNQYHERPQMDMIYEQSLDLEFMMNEATTSNAMPLECGISQEYNQTDQRQYQQQQRPNNDWISLENNQSHQQNSQMTVVYTSTSQNVPKIPDPGGHIIHQSQIMNYNTQQQQPQMIQTGPNGEAVLANMQPVQQMHPPMMQSQPYDMNSGNYVNYVEQPGRSQQYLTQEQMNNSYRQVPVVNHPGGIQSMPSQPAPEPVRPPPKPRAKPQKPANKKKNQPPPQASSGLESFMENMQTKMLEVKFTPESAARMSEIMGKIAFYNNKPGYEQEMKGLENEVMEIVLRAEIAANKQTAAKQPASKARSQSQQFVAPTPPVMVTQNSGGRRKRTKAELQTQRAAMIASQPTVPMQTPISVNDSCIVAQDSSSITVNIEGKMMRAVMLSNSNGTATYQIQGPVDQPIPLQPAAQSRQKPRSIIEQVTAGPEENKRMMTIVSDIIDNCESKPRQIRKTPQRKGKKNEVKAETENIPETKVFTAQPVTKPLEPYCVPSTSNFLTKHKINLPTVAILARNVRDKKENRRRKIADFLNRMKENLATTDISSPFVDKQDVLQRILPYGFHYEPFISDSGVKTFDYELTRHRVHNEMMKESLDRKMKNLFLRETMQQNFDSELDMMLTLDIDYEKKLLEKEKAAAEKDKESFVVNSDIIKSRIKAEEIDEAKRSLVLKKPKHPQTKHYRGFSFEIRDFDEEAYRRRRQDILDQIEKEKQAKLAALNAPSSDESSDSSISPPPRQPSPQKIKVPETPRTEPVKPPVQVKTKPFKILSSSSSSSSDDSSSDESYVRAKTHKQEKKIKHRSPSPQKKKSSPTRKSFIKKFENPVDAKSEKPQMPPSKPKQPPQLPPEYSSFPPITFTNYRIPKITETSNTGQNATNQPERLFNHDSNKLKANLVEPVKIRKSDISSRIISHDSSKAESNKVRKSDSYVHEKPKAVAQDVTNVEPIKIRKSDGLHIPGVSTLSNQNLDAIKPKREEHSALMKTPKLEPTAPKPDSIQKFKIKLPLKENVVEKPAEKEKERHHKKEKKERQKEEQMKTSVVEPVTRDVAPSLKLKINVGSIKKEANDVELDREAERKRKKKHKKEKREKERELEREREREHEREKERKRKEREQEKERKREKERELERERKREEERELERERKREEEKEKERKLEEEKEKERKREKEEKKLRKLEKEQRKAAKLERKRQKEQIEIGNQSVNAVPNNHVSSTAPSDPPRLVFRFKIEPPTVVSTQETSSAPTPSASTINTVQVKTETHEKKSHKEHKKEKKHKREHSSSTVSESPVPPKIPKLTIKFGSTPGPSTTTATKVDVPQKSVPDAKAVHRPKDSPKDPLRSSVPSTNLNSHSFMQTNVFNDKEAGLFSRVNVRSESPLSMDSKVTSELEVNDLKAITGKILIKLREE